MNTIFLLDGDDVVLKTAEEKIKWMRRNLADEDLVDKARTVESIQPWECNRTTLVGIIGTEAYDQMGFYVYGREGTMAIQAYEGALEGVMELSRMGHVYVISARRPDHTQNTRNRLQALGFGPYIRETISDKDPSYKDIQPLSGSKKAGIARYLGARMLVDDDERHMPKEQVDGLDCLLFGPGDRTRVMTALPHIVIAPTWTELVQYAIKYKRDVN